eukprot:gene4766-6846_t
MNTSCHTVLVHPLGALASALINLPTTLTTKHSNHPASDPQTYQHLDDSFCMCSCALHIRQLLPPSRKLSLMPQTFANKPTSHMNMQHATCNMQLLVFACWLGLGVDANWECIVAPVFSRLLLRVV